MTQQAYSCICGASQCLRQWLFLCHRSNTNAEKEAALKAQIRDAQKAAASEKREIDKKRAAIIGIALSAEMQENQELAKQLEPIILRHVTKVRDRTLLGLPPLQK